MVGCYGLRKRRQGLDVKFGGIFRPQVGELVSGRGPGTLTLRLAAWIGIGCVFFETHAAFGGESERIVEAFNWTVVFLMAMPYVILGGVAGWIFYRYTRSSRKRVVDQPASSVHLVKKGASSR